MALKIYRTSYMKLNPQVEHNTLIIITLPPNTDINALLKIRHIDNVTIKIEPLMNNKVQQCKNCQRFGHSAGGCQHTHRCVKCGDNHYKPGCPRTNNNQVKLKCCNCGGEHTANNLSSCPYAQKYISGISSNNSYTNRINNSTPNVTRSTITNNNSINRNQSGNSNTPKMSRTFINNTSAFPKINDKYIQTNRFSKAHTSNHSYSYAQVVANSETPNHESTDNDLLGKINFLINTVLKHEQLLMRFFKDG